VEIFAIDRNLLLQLVTRREPEGETTWWWWDTAAQEHAAYGGREWNGDAAVLGALLWALRAGMAIATGDMIRGEVGSDGRFRP
jgi:hypothetical protein